MRSFSFLMAGLFLIYSIQTPRALAARTVTPDEATQIGKNILADMDREGFEILDKDGKTLSPADFLSKPQDSFSIVSPELENGDRLKIRASSRVDETSVFHITLIATDNANGKILSRRTLHVDTRGGDAAIGKLRIKQTVTSLEKDIAKAWVTKKVSTASRLGAALASVFGIPFAHAGQRQPLEVTIARIIIGGFVGVVAHAISYNDNPRRPYLGHLAIAFLASLFVSYVLDVCSKDYATK